MGEASSTSTLRTLMPSGGVWGVLRIMPRICFAAASAPAGSSASLTPPALPRPPACTWALTTTLPPSRDVLRLGGSLGHLAVWHRNAKLAQDGLGLVLVDLHAGARCGAAPRSWR